MSGAEGNEQRVIVVGAGIIGVCCALALCENGFSVTVLDKDGPGEATSFGAAGNLGGNAHFAIPGLIWKLPRMLLDRQHPLSLRWRDLPELVAWFRRYSSYAPAEHAARISKAGAALSAGIFEAYDTLLRDAGAQDLVTKRGRLFVWSTEAGWEKDQYGLAIRRQRGIHLDELSGGEVREMEPALGPIVRRGVYAPNAGHIVNPHRLVITLAALLRQKGGEIRRESVRTIEFAGDGRPVVVTDQGRREADQVVLAAGVWSRDFAGRLGTGVPLVAERGYHTMMPEPGVAMKVSTLWEERKVIFTPMEHGLRASGIAEFAVRDAPPRFRLAERLKHSALALIPGLKDAGSTQWMGRRPVTPDYLPVIGRAPRHPRVIFAFGHGHSGYNLGPGTGRLVGEIAAGRTPNIDIAPYRPDRF
jgi:D-amino-acid dehydrogenase